MTSALNTASSDFYPRPPRGGRPRVVRIINQLIIISIHALREEGDRSGSRRSTTSKRFLSTPSARRATSCHALFLAASAISIHALREEGDPLLSVLPLPSRDFYPRPPRGGRLHLDVIRKSLFAISIHALREEGDGRQLANLERSYQFLSTPSARRATRREGHGADGWVLFLSTPSARRATTRGIMLDAPSLFLSTPSARRATLRYGKPARAI